MKYQLRFTGEFKRSLKRCLKRGYKEELLIEVLNILVETGHLPNKYKPHLLQGNYKGFWECHITSDWLLVWKQDDRELILLITNTGTHSDLFG